jgi:hypothetical protein
MNLVSLEHLGYVRFFSLSSQSNTSLHLLFFFSHGNSNPDYSIRQLPSMVDNRELCNK